MSKLKIKIYPDAVLRKRADEIDLVDSGVKKLADDMIRTMYEGDGAGLAGPQVGLSKRIFVIDAGDGPQVFINPKIFNRKGRQTEEEGCLSLPGLAAKVSRAKSLICEFLDKDGKAQKVEAGGLLARIIQHENDHLDGILFTDRIGWFARRRLMKEYKRNKVNKS